MGMSVLCWPELLVGVYVLNGVPDFNEETRIPECEKPSNGAETLVTEARRESLSQLAA